MQDDDFFGALYSFGYVVCDGEDGCARLALPLAQLVYQFVAEGSVEAGEGFVE